MSRRFFYYIILSFDLTSSVEENMHIIRERGDPKLLVLSEVYAYAYMRVLVV